MNPKTFLLAATALAFAQTSQSAMPPIEPPIFPTSGNPKRRNPAIKNQSNPILPNGQSIFVIVMRDELFPSNVELSLSWQEMQSINAKRQTPLSSIKDIVSYAYQQQGHKHCILFPALNLKNAQRKAQQYIREYYSKYFAIADAGKTQCIVGEIAALVTMNLKDTFCKSRIEMLVRLATAIQSGTTGKEYIRTIEGRTEKGYIKEIVFAHPELA